MGKTKKAAVTVGQEKPSIVKKEKKEAKTAKITKGKKVKPVSSKPNESEDEESFVAEPIEESAKKEESPNKVRHKTFK